MSKTYKVWCPSDGESIDDAIIFEALDAGDAAQQWANMADCMSANYEIADGEAVNLLVLEEGEVTPVQVEVVGEMERVYYATVKAGSES